MPERDGERDDLRPTPRGTRSRLPMSSAEEVVRVEFPDDQLQECARPRERRRTRCERAKRAWTKLLPPPLGIELLLGSSGVFEESIDVEGEIVDLAHAQTSVIATRASVLACRNAGGLGRPRLRVGDVMPREDVLAWRRTRVSGPS
jgi:hypothetical protein